MEQVAASSLPGWSPRSIGYAYAGRWHARAAYRFSAEVTVYVDPSHVGRRVGSHLYAALFPIVRARGIHAILGGIALPNPASVALHERCGWRRSRTSGRWGSSLAAGSTWATGSVPCERPVVRCARDRRR
jgi:GNAT superfamily N-acetyltransferase